ncbi:ankyrin repeat domain-containing protein [Chryseobacterium proteolyticum]|uniref:ankyrin repeat domain-containing protein n=1 Tax=Chryseobacterium proteolyticum TaxID=118127 RepID=UPI0039832817
MAYSVRFDKKNIFNYLLTNNVDVNKICSNLSPLMAAAKFGRPDLAKILLKKGASKNLKNENGETAKDISVKYKQAALTEILK